MWTGNTHRKVLLGIYSLLALFGHAVYIGARPALLLPFSITTRWTVVAPSSECLADEGCPRAGEQVLSIGSVFRPAPTENPIFSRPLQDLELGSAVEVTFLRAGQRTTYLAEPSRAAPSSYAPRAAGLFFWFAGVLVLMVDRHSAPGGALLTAVLITVSLVLSAGSMSLHNVRYSLAVFRAAVNLLPALLIHFYLVHPSPMNANWQRGLVRFAYGTAAALFVASVVPRTFAHGTRVVLWLSAAVVIGIALGWVRLRSTRSPGERAAVRLNLFGLAMGVAPLLLVAAMSYGELLSRGALELCATTTFVLLLPLWPLSHLASLAREKLYEKRLDRWLGAYSFWCVFASAWVYSFAIARDRLTPAISERELVWATLFGFAVAAPVSRRVFRSHVDRAIFGMRWDPRAVFTLFAAQIPGAGSSESLRAVLTSGLLPELGIHQSALVSHPSDARVVLYWDADVFEPQPPMAAIDDLLRQSDRRTNLASHGGTLGWVRLLVPLTAGEGVVGTWLIGPRDPDEYYPARDVDVLATLARHLSPIIVNMHLAEQRRRDMERNQELQEQLIQAQKMEAVGRLAAGVAHDFNNVLAVIDAHASMIELELASQEQLEGATAAKLAGDVENIHMAVDRAKNFIQELLTFTRQQPINAQLLDLNTIVVDARSMLQRLLRRDVRLAIHSHEELPRAVIDASRATQVLMNLVVNASDAMPDGGDLVIATDSVVLEEASRDARQEVIPPGRYVVLRIADSGSGIEPEQISRIFDPYFTTKPIGKGTGLGLAIVYGIARQHQGFVRVASGIGRGTTFEILFPEREN